MGLITLFTVVSPTDASRFPQRLSELLEPLRLTATTSQERDDGSRLILLECAAPEMHLGVGVVSVEAGTFQPVLFDEQGQDPEWCHSIRTLCKIGARECQHPTSLVLKALELAAGLAQEGRIYDLHASRAYSPEEALKLTSEETPFDIRQFVSYHYLAPPTGQPEHSWLHLHGMAKFFRPDLEAFDVHPDVSHRALALLMHLATESATGTRHEVDRSIPYGHGAFILRSGDAVRPHLKYFSTEDFDEEHSTTTLVVEDAGIFHSLDKLLRGVYELEPKTREECTAELKVWQKRIEEIRSTWKYKIERVIVRAAFNMSTTSTVEHIWVDIQDWTATKVTGSLLNDAYGDPRMVRGSIVTFDESTISGVALRKDDQILDEVETLRVLNSTAAQHLDQALIPPRSARQTGESTSPDRTTLIRFEDDGLVGALLILTLEERQPIRDPIWLYNRLPTPPILDLRRLVKLGRPPLLSEVYTCQQSPTEAPILPKVSFEWEESIASITLNGELWAIVDTAQRQGWSRNITLPNRFGRPLSEIVNQYSPQMVGSKKSVSSSKRVSRRRPR